MDIVEKENNALNKLELGENDDDDEDLPAYEEEKGKQSKTRRSSLVEVRETALGTERRLSIAGGLKSSDLIEESDELMELQQEEMKRKLKTDYAMVLSSTIVTRCVLLQLVPQLTVISIYCATTSTTPIFVYSDKVRQNLPEMSISAPFTEARAQEQERIDEMEWIRQTEMTEDMHCIPNPETKVVKAGIIGSETKVVLINPAVRAHIEKANEASREKMRAILQQPARTVNEWMVMVNGVCMYVLDSRGFNYFVNLYKFILTLGMLLSGPEYIKMWMASAVLILFPYALIIGLKMNVTLGMAMDITDEDIGRLLDCVGLSCVLRFLISATGSKKKLVLTQEPEQDEGKDKKNDSSDDEEDDDIEKKNGGYTDLQSDEVGGMFTNSANTKGVEMTATHRTNDGLGPAGMLSNKVPNVSSAGSKPYTVPADEILTYSGERDKNNLFSDELANLSMKNGSLSFYTGGFKNGMFEGRGRLVYADGSSHEGFFNYGQKHGTGFHTTKDGKVEATREFVWGK